MADFQSTFLTGTPKGVLNYISPQKGEFWMNIKTWIL
jgi:hypothetical protein